MFIKLIKKYPDLITDISIKRFRKDRSSYELLAILSLKDKSEIHIKEYLFSSGTRKYAYHWQTEEGTMIGRWDNSAHWPSVKTYPHHFHDGSSANVQDSLIRTIDDRIKGVRVKLKQEGKSKGDRRIMQVA